METEIQTKAAIEADFERKMEGQADCWGSGKKETKRDTHAQRRKRWTSEIRDGRGGELQRK